MGRRPGPGTRVRPRRGPAGLPLGLGGGPLRVACLGNSNTDSGWQLSQEDGFPPEEAWCERLADEAEPLNTRNCGWGGATAAANTTALPYFQGAGQLEAALSDPAVEIVILALGTNDLGLSLTDPDRLLLDPPTPAAIADVIATLAAAVEAAGASVLVATTPYRIPPDPGLPSPPEGINDLIGEFNNELALRFEADAIIDFSSGLEPADFLSDGTHMSSSGMAKRAAPTQPSKRRSGPSKTRPMSRFRLASFFVL